MKPYVRETYKTVAGRRVAVPAFSLLPGLRLNSHLVKHLCCDPQPSNELTPLHPRLNPTAILTPTSSPGWLPPIIFLVLPQ